eukprot:363865-Chlamydomonas_euryale.AAC.1
MLSALMGVGKLSMPTEPAGLGVGVWMPTSRSAPHLLSTRGAPHLLSTRGAPHLLSTRGCSAPAEHQGCPAPAEHQGCPAPAEHQGCPAPAEQGGGVLHAAICRWPHSVPNDGPLLRQAPTSCAAADEGAFLHHTRFPPPHPAARRQSVTLRASTTQASLKTSTSPPRRPRTRRKPAQRCDLLACEALPSAPRAGTPSVVPFCTHGLGRARPPRIDPRACTLLTPALRARAQW